ncbi:hypothetical protein C8Q76DRAFT_311756 [Earliella scabrosa]|nr:hypothetical protein C8Q76DRAFT_311756 [Earliella scabrosa]
MVSTVSFPSFGAPETCFTRMSRCMCSCGTKSAGRLAHVLMLLRALSSSCLTISSPNRAAEQGKGGSGVSCRAGARRCACCVQPAGGSQRDGRGGFSSFGLRLNVDGEVMSSVPARGRICSRVLANPLSRCANCRCLSPAALAHPKSRARTLACRCVLWSVSAAWCGFIAILESGQIENEMAGRALTGSSLISADRILSFRRLRTSSSLNIIHDGGCSGERRRRGG